MGHLLVFYPLPLLSVMTIDEFIGQLPPAGGELRFSLGSMEFCFFFPASFDEGAAVVLAGERWAEVCATGFPASTELSKYVVSPAAARKIGQLQAALKTPQWEHLDWHKLACLHGDAFATITNRVESWIQQLYSLTVTEVVEAEKKS